MYFSKRSQLFVDQSALLKRKPYARKSVSGGNTVLHQAGVLDGKICNNIWCIIMKIQILLLKCEGLGAL